MSLHQPVTTLATLAAQTAGNGSLSSIDSKTPVLGQALAASSMPVVLTASQLTTLTPLSSVSVSNFPATQAVTGVLTDTQLRASPLPVTGTFFQATQPVSGTFFQATQPISASALPLPSGASTSALQSTGNTSVASIDTKTPALGQALAASSVPIVLTAAQLTALTPLSSVSVSNFPASQAVTGTFFQATQPVSIASMPSTPVTGTFFQATQPISAASLPLPTGAATSALQTTGNSSLSSIDTKTPALGQALAAASIPVVLTAAQLTTLTPLSSISVSNFPATQAVSGTFFQATQPVSGTVAANATLSAETTKVIGTVNVAAAQTIAVTNSGTFATQSTLAAETTKVIGTVNLSSAQTLSTVTTVGAVTAITNALPTGANVIGKVSIDQTTPGTTNLVSIGTTGTVGLNAGAASIGTVQQAALTKGNQGATGVTVQNLKDAGRNQTNYFMLAQIVSTATDTLMSLTGYKGGAAIGATTTPAVVTAAKIYRISSVTLTYVTIVTTPGAVRFTLRANTGGVVAITSPAVAEWTVGEPTGVAPVAGKFNTVHISFPDGIEFAAGTGIGLSMVGLNTVGTAAVVGYGQATIHGYEY